MHPTRTGRGSAVAAGAGGGVGVGAGGTSGGGIRTSLVCAAGYGQEGALTVFSAGLRTEVRGNKRVFYPFTGEKCMHPTVDPRPFFPHKIMGAILRCENVFLLRNMFHTFQFVFAHNRGCVKGKRGGGGGRGGGELGWGLSRWVLDQHAKPKWKPKPKPNRVQPNQPNPTQTQPKPNLSTQVVVDLAVPGATGVFSTSEGGSGQRGLQDTLVLVSSSSPLLAGGGGGRGVRAGYTRVLAFKEDLRVVELAEGEDNPFVCDAATVDVCAMAGGTVVQAHAQVGRWLGWCGVGGGVLVSFMAAVVWKGGGR